MKRLIALSAVLILTVAMLVGCSPKKTEKMKEDVAVAETEAKDNLDEMIENATVSDEDGYIDEEHTDDATVETVTGAGIIDDNGALLGDSTDGEEMTVAEDFI